MEIEKITNDEFVEAARLLYNQICAVSSLTEEEDPWLYVIYKQPLSKLNNILFTKKINSVVLEEVRQMLHLCNSSVANMSIHGASEKTIIDDERLFSYLYSLHDLIRDLLMQAEVDDSDE